MKKNFLKLFSCVLFFAAIFFLNCTKPENEPAPPDGKPDTTRQSTSLNPDTVANHLLFLNATKKPGSPPQGKFGSLKSKIKDTVHLSSYLGPIEFLHEDTTQNVSGAFIKIHTSGGSSFYYDVPELPDVAESDTVSVIMVGIDPEGIVDADGVPPAGPGAIDIIIFPYDPKGNIIDEATKPVKIHVPTDNGPCGIITEPGDYWDWRVTYTFGQNHELVFDNTPDKLWGLKGQMIKGCCTDGVSDYTANCDSANVRSLNFQTFFNWPSEIYKFIEDHTYAALTEFLEAIPEPKESDFCGNGRGVVKEDFNRNFHEGNWSVTNAINPQGKSEPYLTMQGITPGVMPAARPIGFVKLADCELLITSQPDREGGPNETIFWYQRNKGVEPRWVKFS